MDTERVWKAVAGELAPDERRDVIDRVALDPAYAEAWRVASELLRASGARVGGGTPDEERTRATGPSLSRSSYLLAAAASLLVGFVGLLLPRLLPPPEPAYRGGPIAPLTARAESLPRDAFRLRWEGPQGARFDLRVTTEDLSPLATATDLSTPEYVVPPERLAALPSGARILWQVEARLVDGTLIRSETFIAALE